MKQAEFCGGVLVCNGVVAVRRVSKQTYTPYNTKLNTNV